MLDLVPKALGAPTLEVAGARLGRLAGGLWCIHLGFSPKHVGFVGAVVAAPVEVTCLPMELVGWTPRVLAM
jgi:hypothetical protein